MNWQQYWDYQIYLLPKPNTWSEPTHQQSLHQAGSDARHPEIATTSSIQNSKFKIQNYLELFCLVLTIIAAIILMSSSLSVSNDNNFDDSIICVVIRILNQYLVSLASLRAISSLCTKSALL